MVQQKLWQETLWDTCSCQEFGLSAESSVFSLSQGVKVLPLFTHCFCCRPGCESGAPLTQFTLAGCECLLRATGCGQACPGLFCTASPYSLEAGMDEWPSLGKYYHLPENAGSELYPKEARQHSGENLISSWVKLPRLYTWREAETSAFEKVTWEHSLTS